MAGKPKPFTKALAPGVDPFAGEPLKVSDELRAQMFIYASSLLEEVG